MDFIYPRDPVYFVTFCTRDRRRIPDLEKAQAALESYAQRGVDEFGAALGRYIIMPDHIHLFVSGDPEFVLSKWVAGLKRTISKLSGSMASSGSRRSSITFCAVMRVIPKNGNMFVRIR
jgi:REP element-mobilizing transposase RayT